MISSKEIHPKGFSGLATLSSYMGQDSQPGTALPPGDEKKTRTPKQILLNTFWTVGLNALMVFLPSGTLWWMNAWQYLITVGVSATYTGFESSREKQKVTEAEDLEPPSHVPGFILFFLVLIQITISMVAGFDHRWQWAPLRLGWMLWIPFGFLILTPLSTLVIRIPQSNRKLIFLLGSANTISIPLLLESGVASALAILVILTKWRYLLYEPTRR